MARARVQRFIATVKAFDELRQAEGDKFDLKLEGGKSVVQKQTDSNGEFTDPKRPKYSKIERAHYVQANIVYNNPDPHTDPQVHPDNWPNGFQRYIGDTMDNPTSWNQGIDQTIDRTQKMAIDRYNKNHLVDEDFVKKYIAETIAQINEDMKGGDTKKGKTGKYQYDNMDSSDIKAHIDELSELLNNKSFLQALVNGELPNEVDAESRARALALARANRDQARANRDQAPADQLRADPTLSSGDVPHVLTDDEARAQAQDQVQYQAQALADLDVVASDVPKRERAPAQVQDLPQPKRSRYDAPHVLTDDEVRAPDRTLELAQARADKDQVWADQDQVRANELQARADQLRVRAAQTQARAAQAQARAAQAQDRAAQAQDRADQDQARANRDQARVDHLRAQQGEVATKRTLEDPVSI